MDEIRRRRSENQAAGTASTKSRLSKMAEEAGATPIPVSIAEPIIALAGVVDLRGLKLVTLEKRGRARLDPGLEQVLVEDEFAKLLRKAEEGVLREWAVLMVLSTEAEKRGMEATQEQVDDRLEELATAGGQPGNPSAVLEKFGLDIETFTRELRASILVEQFVMDEIDRRYTTDQLRQVHQANINSFSRPESARVLAIIKDVSRMMNDKEFDAAFDAMEDARDKIASGASFADIARQVSIGMSRRRGGELGLLDRSNQLPAPFNSMIFDMDPGELSDVEVSDDGQFLYILRVEEILDEGVTPFEQSQREVKLLLFDTVQADLYEELRRGHMVLLNASGLSSTSLAKVETGRLELF